MDPAHAGMILKAGLMTADGKNGPRACGDDPNVNNFSQAEIEWTPRMRG